MKAKVRYTGDRVCISWAETGGDFTFLDENELGVLPKATIEALGRGNRTYEGDVPSSIYEVDYLLPQVPCCK